MTDKNLTASVEMNDLFSEFAIKTEGVEYQIVNVDKKGMGFFITLRSPDSPEVQKVSRAIRTATNKTIARGKTLTAEQEIENSIAIISAAISGWRWGLDHEGKQASAGGEQLEFNPANVKRIVSVQNIRMQLDDQLMEEKQFFRNAQ